MVVQIVVSRETKWLFRLLSTCSRGCSCENGCSDYCVNVDRGCNCLNGCSDYRLNLDGNSNSQNGVSDCWVKVE